MEMKVAARERTLIFQSKDARDTTFVRYNFAPNEAAGTYALLRHPSPSLVALLAARSLLFRSRPAAHRSSALSPLEPRLRDSSAGPTPAEARCERPGRVCTAVVVLARVLAEPGRRDAAKTPGARKFIRLNGGRGGEEDAASWKMPYWYANSDFLSSSVYTFER